MIDITGQKFNRLFVESFAYSNHGAYWNCKCDCGNYTVVLGSKLRHGRVKSCGCLTKETNFARRKDLTGQQFGRLIALYYQEGKWHCKCDCGTEIDVPSGSLISGRTQSCGCLHKEAIHKNKFKDLLGVVYGNLIVVKYLGFINRKSRWLCKCICGNYCEVNSDKLYTGNKLSCGCDKDLAHCGSKDEIEIKDFIESVTAKKFIKEKTILDGQEIDLYCKELKLGIEYNGSAFHASKGGVYNNKDKYYHRNKFLLAKEKGIRLITIFDIDWQNNKEMVKDRLISVLNNEHDYDSSKDTIITNNDWDDGSWLDGYICIKQIEPESFVYANRFLVYRCGKSVWKKIY